MGSLQCKEAGIEWNWPEPKGQAVCTMGGRAGEVSLLKLFGAHEWMPNARHQNIKYRFILLGFIFIWSDSSHDLVLLWNKKVFNMILKIFTGAHG